MTDTLRAGRIVNRADLATLCAVSLPTIDAWVRKGCPYIEQGSKGREWQFDVAAVIAWRIERAVEDAISSYGGETGRISREEADRRRAIANAITAEIEADTALGTVVRRDEAEADMATFTQALKSGLSNATNRIAARAAAMRQAPDIAALCSTEMNRAFQTAQAELAGRWDLE